MAKRRKSPKPFKRLHEPEFEYIKSLFSDKKATNADIARRTGRGATTIGRIRKSSSYAEYMGTEPNKVSREAKSNTNPEKKQGNPIHSHIGRVERRINDVYRISERTHQVAADAAMHSLDAQHEAQRIRGMLGGLRVVAWFSFLVLATLLFIVLRAIYG